MLCLSCQKPKQKPKPHIIKSPLATYLEAKSAVRDEKRLDGGMGKGRSKELGGQAKEGGQTKGRDQAKNGSIEVW